MQTRYRTRGAVDLSGFNAGIDSIAKAFAPPSAHEILYGAQAQKIREEQSRIADLYARAADPNVNMDVVDRQSVIANLYDPSQSYATVRANNLAAGQRNDADNRRALQQTQMQQRGETDRALLAPVGQGQTRFVPPTIAGAYDLPPTQVGVVEAKPGERVLLPDGRTVEGALKPLSTDEWRAQQVGTLSPELQRAFVFGSTPTTTVQGPGGPRIMTMPEAIGQTPAPDAQKAQRANYRTADGRQGTAYTGNDNAWYDSQTNEKLPPGAQTYTAALQGGADETGLNKTTRSGIQGQLVDLANLESTVQQFDDLIRRDPGAIGTVGAIQGVGQDIAASGRELMGLLNPSLQKMARDAEAGLLDRDVLATQFNPNIPQAQLMENLLVAQLAKVNDPNGRLSNQAMEQTRAALGGGGWFKNAERTRAALDGIRQMVGSKRAMYQQLEPEAAAIGGAARPAAPARAPTAPPTPSDLDAMVRGQPAAASQQPVAQQEERWERGPDGKLRRAP